MLKNLKNIVFVLGLAAFLASCSPGDSASKIPEDLPVVAYPVIEEKAAAPDFGTDADDSSSKAADTALMVSELSAYPWPSEVMEECRLEAFWEMLLAQYGPDCLAAFSERTAADVYAPSLWSDLTGSSFQVLRSDFALLLDPLADEQSRIIRKAAAFPEEISLVFGGDVCLDDNWSNMGFLRSKEEGILACLSPDLVSLLRSCDISMINNEFPFSSRGEPLPDKQFTFRADPSRAEILSQLGIDIVSLANNHAYDFGPLALLDTFDTLDQAGIAYVGAGQNIHEAMQPVYYIINGYKIAFVSATQIERLWNPDTREATEDAPGVLRTLEPEKFLHTIETAKANSDFVIAYVHWGSENVETPDQTQRDLASQFSTAGAGLILGDHSHCLQGFEYVNGVPVIYSLGNFWFNSKTLDTAVLKVALNHEGLVSCQMIPCIQKGCTTAIVDGAEKARILNHMQGISYGVTLDQEGFLLP